MQRYFHLSMYVNAERHVGATNFLINDKLHQLFPLLVVSGQAEKRLTHQHW